MLLIWVGWKKLSQQPIEQITSKAIHLSIMTVSLCILLSALADTHSQFASVFSDSIYSEKIHLNTPLAYKSTRLYLGGFFSYYVYADLPGFSLQQLLSNIGVSIVFITTFCVSLILLTQFKPSILVEFLKEKISALSKKSTPQDGSNFSVKSFALSTINHVKSWIPKKEKVEALYPELEETPFITEEFGSQQKDQTSEPEVHVPFKKEPIESVSVTDEPKISTYIQEPSDQNSQEKKLSSSLSKRENAINQQRVYNGDFKHYKLPSPELLTSPKRIHQPTLKQDLRKQAEVLEETLLSFGIEAKVGEIHCGPTIVSFEVHPATGVKVQKIKSLENDIALNLQAKSIRIIAPIPGKAVVGIEIPAPEPQEVSFKEVLEEYQNSSRKFHIPVLMGQTVTGEHVMTDLSRMPHCIIAGATGTGKSVCINAIVMSMLMNCKPDELKLILIDPKKVELSPYTKLPHMIAPVITEPAEVTGALKWMVREMEHRYEVLKLLGLRNIASFNSREINKEFEDTLDLEIPDSMYYIVCIIDELADLMMLASNEIEIPIARIAQMARAVGIHLVLATQRPSREVITGLIKANFPTRISFKVASRVNSQIILDETGAESLLGSGDMLFMPPGAASLVRTQGCFIYDQDVNKIVDNICEQSPPNYLIKSFDQDEGVDFDPALTSSSTSANNPDLDTLYGQALDLVLKTGSISTTFVQRKLKIGYARAASIVDQLEEQGHISGQDGSKPRKLLSSPKKDDDDFA
ncbi:MAG: DNA translocase FtsK [Chlamydiae bacterium]|nr:DNA translocase FtsK [Chlamydiota bacterium]